MANKRMRIKYDLPNGTSCRAFKERIVFYDKKGKQYDVIHLSGYTFREVVNEIIHMRKLMIAQKKFENKKLKAEQKKSPKIVMKEISRDQFNLMLAVGAGIICPEKNGLVRVPDFVKALNLNMKFPLLIPQNKWVKKQG